MIACTKEVLTYVFFPACLLAACCFIWQREKVDKRGNALSGKFQHEWNNVDFKVRDGRDNDHVSALADSYLRGSEPCLEA